MMSAPPARSQEAWAARRLWKVTVCWIFAALTAGVQYLVRKLLRDRAVPALEVNSSPSSYGRAQRDMTTGALACLVTVPEGPVSTT